ncbi:MAG TPA: DUF2478 domain-containing protein [Azoarcus taiwanensis]|nr:DUF2478 domain-containing protein [Azoarcus taiwanensis]
MNADTLAPIAAVVYKPTDHVEPLLLRVAIALRNRGLRVGGVLQHDMAAIAEDPCAMELEDLHSGEKFALSQELGSGSEACRLDPASLAHAAVAIRRALDDGVDVVMFNKFGAQEAGGAGLRDEMGLAVVSGVPMLTAVGERFLDEWETFTGGVATVLPPDDASILAWCDQTLGT